MKLWIVREIEYDDDDEILWGEGCSYGVVVRAIDEQSAREFASNNAGFEKTKKYDPWLDPQRTECNELTPEGSPGLILQDYLYG